MQHEAYEFEPKFKKELTPEELMHIIFDYAAKVNTERNLDDSLAILADMGREMVTADRCTLWLLDRENEELWTKIAHGIQ